MSASLPSVSVIMPAWNEAATIGEQLEALARQVGVTPLEIIVADNGSTDDTVGVIEDFVDRLPQLRWISADGVRGPSHARNQAALLARGEALAFCDADDRVDDHWLAELIPGLVQADLVSGPLSTGLLNRSVTNVWRTTEQSGPPRAGGFFPVAVTSNMAILRETFLQVGMFDENFTWGHDDEFSYRVQLMGLRYLFMPRAVVNYRLRSTIRAMMRREYQDEIAAAHLYRVYGDVGYPRHAFQGVIRHWAWLVVRLPDLASPATRGRWLRKAAGAAGRIRGSLKYRIAYL